MGRRGRRSSASLTVVSLGTVPRLRPPPDLTKPEQALFTELVASNPPTHFVQSDLPAADLLRAGVADGAAGFPRHGAGYAGCDELMDAGHQDAGDVEHASPAHAAFSTRRQACCARGGELQRWRH